MTMPDGAVEPEDLEPTEPPQERDLEAPEGDYVEQATPVDLVETTEEWAPLDRGLEVNEYDALEQAHIVELDDEYR